ncbi:hypothetical protein C6988_07865 [Nitrosopumilus sp. b1]|uniref:sialidase family protein n=1 Tax=Nitrosopumilus sp. b1 TaxID=2109907 RepID=UPI0015F46352|nr:sialidase family protein [Nitrosopumilus sp. b1]KAF6242581.1 hypothetical protein C6988_07865 [Nitrosopumilus sp. b1]
MKNNNSKSILIFLTTLILGLSIFSIPHGYGDGFNFHTPVNLSNDGTTSLFPDIASDGDNIFVVWQDDDGAGLFEIFLRGSTNNGTTFAATKNISNLANTFVIGFESPKIITSGSNVYVVWDDDDPGTPQIFFTNSTDNGANFDSSENLSNSFGFAENPKVAIDGSNVYVVYQDDDPGPIEVFFTNSTDNGRNFDTPVVISNTIGFSEQPEIAVSSGNVYIVWHDDVDGDNDIQFVRSTNNGDSFSARTDLSVTTEESRDPRISTNGNNVYVVWQEFDGSDEEINFRASSNNGTSFGTTINISNNAGASTIPEIAVNGTNVHLVWQDDTDGDNEIFYSVSTNNGTSFSTPTNLSDNTGSSTNPQIVASGSNVYIIWQDNTDGDNDILFRASTNNGTSFATTVNVSNDGNDSQNPRLASSGSNVHFSWTDITLGDIFYVNATQTPSSISYNASQYRLSEISQLTVSDDTSNSDDSTAEVINVNVISSTDSTGISVPLTETGQNTGVFQGTFGFTAATSSGTSLQANKGDTITTTFNSIINTASIFSSSLVFDSPTYHLGESAQITVTDQNSNTNPSLAETITSTITSDTFPGGISLQLEETGVNTGQFQNTDLIFMTGNDLFQFTDVIKVSQLETILGTQTDNTITTILVDIGSSTAPNGLQNFVLTETGPNTGLFESTFNFTSSASFGSSLQAANGDIITVTYNLAPTNALLIPNPDPKVGALQAKLDDDITASFLAASDTARIIAGNGGGGGVGGGGLIRPGLVVDLVLPIISTGGSGGISSISGESPSLSPPKSVSNPNFVPLSINGNNFALNDKGKLAPMIENKNDESSSPKKPNTGNSPKTIKIEKGKNTEISLNIYSPLGIKNIEHVSFYVNEGGIAPKNQAESTGIVYDKGNVIMLNGLSKLADGGITLSEDGDFVTVKINFNFASVMSNSDIEIKIWDTNRFSTVQKIEDAIQVVPQEEIVEQQIDSPNFVQQGIIDPNLEETDELESIEHISQENILANPSEFIGVVEKWGGFAIDSASDVELLKTVGIEGEYIPKWFKENARLIVNDELSVEEFVNAVNYLHKMKIIT